MSIFTGSPTLPTAKEQREAKQYDAKGILDLVGLAARSEFSTEFFAESVARDSIPGERDFVPSVDLLLEMTAPLADGTPWPEGEYSDYAGAQSETEMRLMRAQRANRLQMRQELARAGWTGIGLQIGAAILDPVDVAIGVGAGFAAGPLGLTGHYAKKLSTINRLSRAGLLGAASVAPVAGYLAAEDPAQDETDVLLALAMGGAFGAGGEAIGGALRSRRYNRLRKDAEFVQVARANFQAGQPTRAMGAAGSAEGGSIIDSMREILTPEGRDYFAEQIKTPEPPAEPPNPPRPAPEQRRPHEMTRAEFEATGEDVLHGTNRGFDRFDASAPNRFGKQDGQRRFYFTQKEEVAHTFAHSGGHKQVDLYKWVGDDEFPEDIGAAHIEELRKALDAQLGKKRLWWYDDDGKFVEVKSAKEISDDAFLEQADVRLYDAGREPRVIKTRLFGRMLDLTDENNIPDGLKEVLQGTGFRPWERGLPNFQHEYAPKLIEWARANNYGKIKVRDVYESGFESIIGLEEYIGFNRDPHRAFVEQALDTGGTIHDEVLADYPDLRAAEMESRRALEQARKAKYDAAQAEHIEKVIAGSGLDEIEDADVIEGIRELGRQGIIDRYSDWVDPDRNKVGYKKIEPEDEIDAALHRAFVKFEQENAERIREVAVPAAPAPTSAADEVVQITPDQARAQLTADAQKQDPDALIVVGHDVDGYWIIGAESAEDAAGYLDKPVIEIDGQPAIKIEPEEWASTKRELIDTYDKVRILRTKTAENGKTYTAPPPPKTKPFVKKGLSDRLGERLGTAFTGRDELGKPIPNFMIPERAERLRIEVDRIEPSMAPEDQLDLMLARFYILDHEGELNTARTGPPRAVSAGDVMVGDSWQIGDDAVEVLAVDADTVTIRQTEFNDSFGIEGLDDPPIERDFTVPKSAALPFNANQGIDRPLTVEIKGVDLSDRPATPEMGGGDPPDIGVPEDRPGGFSLPNLHDAKAPFAKARFDIGVGPGKSSIPEMRMAGLAMMKDLLVRHGDDGKPLPTIYSASQERRRAMNTILAPYRIAHNKAYKNWAKNHGKAAWRQKHRDEFNELVGQSKRSGGANDPDVDAAIRAADKAMGDALDYAKLNNAKGFGHIENDPSYVPRVWNERHMHALAAKYDWETVDQVIAGALRNAQNLSEEHALEIATGMRKTILDNRLHDRIQKARLFAGDLDEDLAVILNDLEISEDAKEAILGVLSRPDTGDRGVNNRARRRVLLDETAIVETKRGAIPLTALIDNSIEHAVDSYTSSLVGSAVSQRVYRALTPESYIERNGHAYEAFSQVRDMLQRRIEEITDLDLRRVEETYLNDLELIDRHIRGLPLQDNTAAHRLARRILGINYARQSGGFGLAQMAELGILIGENPKVFAAHFPTTLRVMRRLADGKLSDDLAAELEGVFGTGTDDILQRFSGRLYDLADENQNIGRGFDTALHQIGQTASQVSGFAHINAYLQRMAAKSVSESIYRQAISGRRPKVSRIRALGLTDDQWDTLAKALKENRDAGIVIREEGVLGRRVSKFNLNDWADQDSATLFARAIQTYTERAIQMNDIGMMPKWFLTNDWVRILFQFRTFAAVSWQNQVLSRLQHRDAAAAVGAVLSGVIGGLTWGVRSYITSLPREDAEEYRQKYLTPGKMLAAGFQRSSVSFIAPEIADTIAGLGGIDPIFNARYTGLSNQILVNGDLSSSPTGQTLNAITKSLTGVGSAITGQDAFTEKDMRAITNLVPFQNALGVRQALDLLVRLAPDDE